MIMPTRLPVPMRPAAYIRLASGPGALTPARQRDAIVAAARGRGWPDPVVYADEGPVPAEGLGPALASLSAAIGTGRHDAVIVPGAAVISRSSADIMAFLFRCTRHGVAVEFLGPLGTHAVPVHPAAGARCLPPPPAPADRRTRQFPLPSAARRPRSFPLPSAARRPLPVPLPGAARITDVLTRAGVEALSGLFADWRIWADQHGWHARRRSDGYLQAYRRGAPAFCVHAVSAEELAAQLRWQQAADIHAPAGCSSA
jgi:Resolvase, N terminal domain